jgi:hypothetical protein
LPPALDRFFETALAKDRELRFPTGAAFRAALDDAVHPPAPGAGVSPLPHATPTVPIARARRARRPVVVAACVLLALVALAAHRSGRRAWLRLQGKSTMRDASLTVLVDGREVFERDLSAPEVPAGWLRRRIDPSRESFEQWIPVSPGKHEIAAVVTPEGDGQPYQDSIVVDLDPREKRRLRLVAGRSLGSPVSLELD